MGHGECKGDLTAMNIILLSGGSGKRLWPLSNEVRSKQFLKIFKRADGRKESMAQRMYRMIKEADPDATVIIATGENQVPQIRAQLGEDVGICIEPSRRDTFPAIVLAASYLKKNGTADGEPVVVCPVDPYVEKNYFECLKVLSDEAGKANLTLMGIKPTYPSEKYGYIIPASDAAVSPVVEFKEKPDKETARQYIRQGALWNGGVFAFKLSYLLKILKESFGTDSYDELFCKYSTLTKTSFDYAVVEKEKSINVVRFDGAWKDIGTWNTLSESMDEPVAGNAVAEGCKNTHVINELGIPLIALGLSDAIVAATPDGILVTDKDKSPRIKELVADARPMYERRDWGEYKILDYKNHDDGNNSLVKELTIFPGRHISYQRHRCRTEIWVFTEGVGELVIDGIVKPVNRGEVVIIHPGMKHAIKGITELHIIEVQIGNELTEKDIERLDWNW